MAGFKRLVIERVASTIARLSNTSMPSEGLEGSLEGDPVASIPLAVLESRRSVEGGRHLYVISRWAVEALTVDELNRALSSNIEAAIIDKYTRLGDPGLLGLLRAVHVHLNERALETLTQLAAVVAKEAGRPCTVDQSLRRERDQVEGKMKLYGALLGVAIPLLILLSIIVDIVYLIPVFLASVALWLVIRRDGVRYARLNIEVAWRECRLTESDLTSIAKGMSDPIAEVFYTLLLRQR